MKWNNRFDKGVLLLVFATNYASAQEFKDWAVECDNTRHCEAVGYQAEEATAPVALWLARDAGVSTRITMRLRAEREDETAVRRLSITLAGKTLKDIEPETDLSDAQVDMLLPRLLDASQAEVTDGSMHWTLSLAGVKAALLKMDDVQGRIGTASAIVRKGNKPDTAVPAALPVPTVKLARLPAPNAADDGLASAILKEAGSAGAADCNVGSADSSPPDIAVTRLSNRRVLVLQECSRGAYQNSYRAWTANLSPPHKPQGVKFPTAAGEPTEDVGNADFQDGIMHSYFKGRGIGDCMESLDWAWTDQGFVLIDGLSAPLCRGMAEGGFPLRTWTAKVVK